MSQEEKLYPSKYTLNETALKFIRRTDISVELRLHIACTVLCFNNYGTVTKLAKKYKVSRTFIYYLRSQLLISGWVAFGMLGLRLKEEKVDKKLALTKEILSLRLEGKCPILGISQLLKRKGMCNDSIGYISELLNEIGMELSPMISKQKGIIYEVVWASDEIFSAGQPVLITVDPVSTAILGIELGANRQFQTWESHWRSVLDAGIIPIYLTSDEGTGMQAARKIVFPKVVHQTDTFHAIPHHLGKLFHILEQQTYAAISEEYKQKQLLINAKSQRVSRKRFAAYSSAKAKVNDYIYLYEEFSFWYEYLIEQFQIFDGQGQLLDVNQAKKNVELSVEQIGKLNWFFKTKNEKVRKIMISIKVLLPKLFPFLYHAKEVVSTLLKETSSQDEVLAIQAFCAAYQFRKNSIKTKKTKAKKYFALKASEEVLSAQIILENTELNPEILHKKVYKALDTIIQSSAMVETINSIVRSYFNVSKNQINQAQLNLIKFYHNHRRYVQGKRKGSTPMELLTGKPQEKDWLDLMLEKTNRLAA